MYRLSIMLVLSMFAVLCFAAQGYCEETGATEEVLVPAIDTGIPTVTPEQATGKFKRIVMSIYGSAVEVSPLLTLFIFIVGGTIGVIIKDARKPVFWAIVGMMLVLWGPQLVGLFLYYRGL
ncbi:hypothetical protein JOC37_001345 [Desulfohalotomaculum tongense]|uniref:hypothetical protein n=1 Tax=Desulforadius tongensis TaxID=1216062 RepID=UPI00195CE18A|nr:hypothetical protein [Desulforadius tongensis]MBM7854965.1 hypothetical protein [Desulforadius tongensis]